MKRSYSWPDGHWNWPVKLTHKHGVRAGQMIFTGGQVALDGKGKVQHPGDINRQCDLATEYLIAVLEDLGADAADLVRLVVYFVGDAATEAAVLSQIAGRIGQEVCPVVNTVALPELAYPDMLIEIEGVAMRSEDDTRLERERLRLDDLPPLVPGYSHLVRCADMIFMSDMSALSPGGSVGGAGDVLAQTKIMMDRVNATLEIVGADMADVVKLNVFYAAGGTAQEWEGPARLRAGYFTKPGPAATGVPLPCFANPDVLTKIAVTAMRSADGGRLPRQFSWPEGHWDWTTPLPYQHANRCAGMIHVGGQVSLDAKANVIDPGDMVPQTRRAMAFIASALADLGATLDDVVKATAFYVGKTSGDVLHENLLIRSGCYSEPGPASTGVPVPALAYEDMLIEIEVIAMVGV